MADAENKTHVIRIHAAWQRTELSDAMTSIQSRSLSLPDTHSIDPATCFLSYVRKFNAPTGLTASDTVELDCSMLVNALSISLNGHRLTSPSSASIDITSLLQRHNELTIQLEVGKVAAARSGTARLLIHPSNL